MSAAGALMPAVEQSAVVIVAAAVVARAASAAVTAAAFEDVANEVVKLVDFVKIATSRAVAAPVVAAAAVVVAADFEKVIVCSIRSRFL